MKRFVCGDDKEMKNIAGIKGVFFQYHPDIDILKFHYSGISRDELDFWDEIQKLSSAKHLWFPEGEKRLVLITVGDQKYLPSKEAFKKVQEIFLNKGFSGLLNQDKELFLSCSKKTYNLKRICFSLGLPIPSL